MTLRGVIEAAYGTPEPLPNFRVVGGPNWLDADRFDIEAKTEENLAETQAGPGWSTRGELMLRTLLAERFKLIVHQERRDLPVYALVKARSDGKLGPQLMPSSGTDCVAPPGPGESVRPQDAHGLPICGRFSFTPPDHLSVHGLTIDQIARFIMLNAVDRTVVNRTGLDGRFSMDLEFTRELPQPAPDAATNDRAASSGTSIFTALQEQLGLKLEPLKGPVDVLIIDHVEHPTEN